MPKQLIWIGLFILVSGCYCAYFSAPRSATAFGSKRLLNSFSVLDTQLQIVEYNEDLSLKTTHLISRHPDKSVWLDVKSCDQYYLSLSISGTGSGVITLLLLSPANSFGSAPDQNIIRLNSTVQDLPYIAVAPSGRNFMLMNETHLIVFEVEPQSLNWTIIAEENITTFKLLVSSNFAMSDSKISFLYLNNHSRLDQVIYNYKTNALTVRDLPLKNMGHEGYIDTLNDYWLYTTIRNTLAVLEYPNGDLQMFNISSGSESVNVFILPPQLSTTKEYIDIAIVLSSQTVALGTLNSATHTFEQYNVIPSKSLGLLYKELVTDLPNNENKLPFGVGHSVLMFRLPDNSFSLTLAVPSLPGNHSCSIMDFNDMLEVFWCINGVTPTERCPPGTYQPSFGYTTCLLCPEGTYQPKEGSIDCLKCKENEYCPMGTFKPETLSNSSSHIMWDFPITQTTTSSFEEILLMLLFATSINSNSTSVPVVLLGGSIITGALLISLLVQYCCGVSMHQWLAKIDIHKKTKTIITTIAKPNGTFKTETIKVESVFGGYLTLLAVFILSVGLITTIIYVNDYHPLLFGQYDATQIPSQNSLRTSSLQDYSTESIASELANLMRHNLQLNITITLYNSQTYDDEFSEATISVKNYYDQNGNDRTIESLTSFGSSTQQYNLLMNGTMKSFEAEVTLVFGRATTFTWATVEISPFGQINGEGKFKKSTAKYLILPGQDKVLTGLLIVPVTMTVVVRKTELQEGEFDNNGYVSLVADRSKLRDIGQSPKIFATTNDPMTLQLLLQLDNNWRLESEQRRFSGVGAFFAAFLAIIGLYEVTLLASELAHRIFHSIEKRRKKRSKYHALEDPPLDNNDPSLIVNEKLE